MRYPKMIFAFSLLFIMAGCTGKEPVVEEKPVEQGYDATAFRGEEWYDLVETVQVNREEAHTSFIPYESKEQGLANEKSAITKDVFGSGYVMSLNGEWDFYFADSVFSRQSTTWEENWNTEGWDRITVPSAIQLIKNEDGSFRYKAPLYINQLYNWSEKEAMPISEYPQSPTNTNSVAHYKRTFSLPETYDDRHIFLRTEGISSAYYVFVNGQRVGYSEDSYTEHEFDITPYLNRNEAGGLSNVDNTIAFMVYEYSLGSYLENQDMIHMNGIFRDVLLVTKDMVEIRDVEVKSVLDQGYRNGSIETILKLRSFDDQEHNVRLRATVYKTDTDELIGTAESTVSVNGEADASLNVKVASPKLWFSDTPELYSVAVELIEDDVVKETVVQRTGFRDLKIEDGVMTINGVPLIIKGINRQEMALEVGTALTKDMIVQDMFKLKQTNLNALRTSHYPNQPITYDLADELGIYICDEANIESHYGAIVGDLPSGYPAWNYSVMDRTISMVERDKNHPSIIIWSLGNESTYEKDGKSLDELYPLDGSYCFAQSSSWIKERDPSRFRKYERDNREEIVDIYSSQYWSLDQIREHLAKGSDMPYIQSEYCHAMGNAMGSFADYWDLFRSERQAQGGFIWDFKDQAVLMGTGTFMANMDKDAWLGYGGDFGDTLSDQDFCGNGIFYADGSSSAKSAEVFKVLQDFHVSQVDGFDFVITSELFNSDFSDYQLIASITENGQEISKVVIPVTLEAGGSYSFSMDPYEFADNAFGSIEFRVFCKTDRAWTDAGTLVAYDQIVMQDKAFGEYECMQSGNFDIEDKDTYVTVKTDDIVFTVSKAHGLIDEYKVGGENVFVTNPQICDMRAPISNDQHYSFNENQWSVYANLEGLYARSKMSDCQVTSDENSVTIHWEGYYEDLGNSYQGLTYTIYHDGVLSICQDFHPTWGFEGVIPKIGFTMELDKDINDVQYFGLGPLANYSDRKAAAMYGLYETTVSSMFESRFMRPQENGFRSDAKWVKLTDGHKGVAIWSDQMGFSASPYTYKELREAMHPSDLGSMNEKVILNIDLAQRGLGNAICGPTPEYEYILDHEVDYHQQFYVMPLYSEESYAKFTDLIDN